MRQGFFPGQLESLRELARDGLELHAYRRKSRRAMLALGLGAIAAGVTGFWVGGKRTAATGEVAPEAELAPVARELATASDTELLAGARTYLMAVETLPADDLAWGGAMRLAKLARSLPESDRRTLTERLGATARSPRAPAEVRDAIGSLSPR